MENLVNNGSNVQELFNHYFTDFENKSLWSFSLVDNKLKVEVTLNNIPIMIKDGFVFKRENERILRTEAEKFEINCCNLDKNLISFMYQGDTIELRKI